MNEIKRLESDRRSLLDRFARYKDLAEKLQSQLAIVQAQFTTEKQQVNLYYIFK